ncbi:hypothetical protein UY3_03815 [Chelonia mydas]|uniref:Uncharacterized protein n=1 Tax=Chelonia mydas TaxID=8469 RepID=M7CDV2_CHEMY|nr:hypothetical protein UY3_03815 [Chelonia mydas]
MATASKRTQALTAPLWSPEGDSSGMKPSSALCLVCNSANGHPTVQMGCINVDVADLAAQPVAGAVALLGRMGNAGCGDAHFSLLIGHHLGAATGGTGLRARGKPDGRSRGNSAHP